MCLARTRSLGRYIRLALSAASILIGATVARAGLGPENVFLVVNSASWASQTVANNYIVLRHIPATNVFYIPWTEGTDAIDGDSFRNKILGPIMIQIERRGLSDQIDIIVYSSDFPYSVNLSSDYAKDSPPPQLSPVASLTSATYLWQLVMAKNQMAINLRSNLYVRSAGEAEPGLGSFDESKRNWPTQGFRSWYGWGPNGVLLEGGGLHYMLSTMLAVTSGRGNSVPEAVGYLRRSAVADGTRPRGTIYYCESDDKRSEKRAPGFEAAVKDLKKIGVAAEVLRGALPSGKKDVAGAMVGIANFNWTSAQSSIVPGAICEHLTSFGGAMSENNGQTPLSEFLRYGAAGASGAVVEPYNLQDKFPLPAIQVHYARGCSMAEAFYQSVFGPWQLLIVGDPLCKPWARIPKVTVEGITPGATVSGKLIVKATAKVDAGAVDVFEVFVDGRRVAHRPAGMGLPLDTTNLADGNHELRVVGIDSSPIETQGRAIIPFVIDNRQRSIELTTDNPQLRWGEPCKLKVKGSGIGTGIIFFNGRILGEFKGDNNELEINPQELGLGPVSLYAVGATIDKKPQFPASAPLRLSVRAQDPLPALASMKLLPGMRLKLADGKTVPIQETRSEDWLRSAGIKAGEAFAMEAYFDVPPPDKTTVAALATDLAKQGVHQFQLNYTGDIKIAVDNALLHEGKQGDFTEKFLPIPLAPGLHRLRIAGRAGNDVKLQIRYGGQGTKSLDGTTFRQPAN